MGTHSVTHLLDVCRTGMCTKDTEKREKPNASGNLENGTGI